MLSIIILLMVQKKIFMVNIFLAQLKEKGLKNLNVKVIVKAIWRLSDVKDNAEKPYRFFL